MTGFEYVYSRVLEDTDLIPRNSFSPSIKLSTQTNQSEVLWLNQSNGVHVCINKLFKRIMRQFTKSPFRGVW